MESANQVKWELKSIHGPSNKMKLLGIYNTKEEADFILSKIKERANKTGYSYTIVTTNNELYPSSSYKVGEYLSTISQNHLNKE